ncbi:MAG: BON domain-containing protein [Gammaproteobacteria bacterium]|nr:BON domain-containing protein [Gammaproteobacteria bacterium]MDH3370789.1 BON domain-containing protein [Gammaproteobacteria bacterium]
MQIHFFMAILLSAVLVQACAPVIVAGGATAAVAATDKRSVGTQLDDENIELTARRKLNDDNRLGDDIHINITCFNGTLLLTGEATTAEQRDIVVSLVSSIQGVKRVIDSEINVSEPTAFANRVHDSWITGQIKARMLGTENLKSTRIKVVTERSVVYLMGLVSHSQADLATEDARAVSSVKRVVRMFEYTD